MSMEIKYDLATLAGIVVEESQSIICLSDVESHQLYYLSNGAKKLWNLTDEDWHGKKDFEVLNQRGVSPEYCTDHLLSTDKFYVWQYFNEYCGKYLEVHDKLVNVDGHMMKLTYSRDISHMISMQNALEEKLEEQTILNQCIGLLHSKSKTLEQATDKILLSLREYYDADSTYVFQINSQKRVARHTYECCRRGFPESIERMQNVSDTLVDRWIEKFGRMDQANVEIVGESGLHTDEELELLRGQGVSHLIISPLWNRDDQLAGFIGVSNSRRYANNTNLLYSVSTFIADIFDTTSMMLELNKISATDGLTGLANRYSYEKELSKMEATTIRRLGVAFVDINGLKQMNDNYGHKMGDELILTCTEVLRGIFGSCIYRVGGDEFIMIVEDISEEDFWKMIVSVKEAVSTDHILSISVGHSWSESCNDILSQIKLADEAMYVEKQNFYSGQRNRRQDDK